MAALVALTGSALADGVASRNVVGYQTILTSEGGYTPVAPMFTQIGQTGAQRSIRIGDIVGEFARYDSIQIFDENGDVLTEYTYRNGKWLDEDNEDAADVEIPAGAAFWLSTADEVEVTFSGEVTTESVTVTLGEGYTATGNVMPADVKISDIIFDGVQRYDSIQIFDENGDVLTEYTYRNGKWLDEDNEDAGETVIPAGQAFWVSCANGDATMTLTSPLAVE